MNANDDVRKTSLAGKKTGREINGEPITRGIITKLAENSRIAVSVAARRTGVADHAKYNSRPLGH
jgi:hypothetical protein